MLAHALEEGELGRLDPAAFIAEWKWDGIRVQAAAGTRENGQRVTRLYTRTGEDISHSFPDLTEALTFDGAIDGELLIMRERHVQSFNTLQQRLNRKTVTTKMLSEFPAHLRAYDFLFDKEGDLRDRPFVERRARLEALIGGLGDTRIDGSAIVRFATWQELAAARDDPAAFGAGEDAPSWLPRRSASAWA